MLYFDRIRLSFDGCRPFRLRHPNHRDRRALPAHSPSFTVSPCSFVGFARLSLSENHRSFYVSDIFRFFQSLPTVYLLFSLFVFRLVQRSHFCNAQNREICQPRISERPRLPHLRHGSRFAAALPYAAEKISVGCLFRFRDPLFRSGISDRFRA